MLHGGRQPMKRSKSGTRRPRRKPPGQRGPKKNPENNVKVEHRRPTSTPNGKLIQDLMVAREVKGDYRDFVMIVGARLVDWLGSWDIFNGQGEPVGFEGVLLVHKSKLDTVVDEKFAVKFWDKKLKRRVIPSQAERNPNAARRTT